MILYTDIDPFCCEVLRARVEDGGLLPGEVWQRDIATLTDEELEPFTQIHLFAGIGASPLGFRWAGWPNDWPLITGGFPCQDISSAGKGAGLDGKRSGLFWEAIRVIEAKYEQAQSRGEREPWALLENVGALSARGLDRVERALGAIGRRGRVRIGYRVAALRLGAWAVGSPQGRERWWIVCAPEWARGGSVADVHEGGSPANGELRAGQRDAARGDQARGGSVADTAGNRRGSNINGSDDRHEGADAEAHRARDHSCGTLGDAPGGGCERGFHEPGRGSDRGGAAGRAGEGCKLADVRARGQRADGGRRGESGPESDQRSQEGVSLGDAQRPGLEGHGHIAGEPEVAESRYASPRRYPHVLWKEPYIDAKGRERWRAVPTPQHEWEPGRVYQRGVASCADGIPARLDAALNKLGVAATGNAQCPEVVEVMARAMMEHEMPVRIESGRAAGHKRTAPEAMESN